MGAEPERCGISQASLISGLSKRTLQDLAPTIPGASKPAGRWIFIIPDLRAWSQRINRKTGLCRKTSISGTGSIGRVSRSMGSNIDKAYELALSGRRRNA